MLELDLKLQIINYMDYSLKEKIIIIKVIGLMKDELGGKIMTKFVGLRAKTYSYLTDDGSQDKQGKGTKKCVIKKQLKFENYKNCLEATKYLKQLSN